LKFEFRFEKFIYKCSAREISGKSQATSVHTGRRSRGAVLGLGPYCHLPDNMHFPQGTATPLAWVFSGCLCLLTMYFPQGTGTPLFSACFPANIAL